MFIISIRITFSSAKAPPTPQRREVEVSLDTLQQPRGRWEGTTDARLPWSVCGSSLHPRRSPTVRLCKFHRRLIPDIILCVFPNHSDILIPFGGGFPLDPTASPNLAVNIPGTVPPGGGVCRAEWWICFCSGWHEAPGILLPPKSTNCIFFGFFFERKSPRNTFSIFTLARSATRIFPSPSDLPRGGAWRGLQWTPVSLSKKACLIPHM